MAQALHIHDPFAPEPPARPQFPFPAYGPDEIDNMPRAEADWIVRGLLARGCVTEVTSDVRAGKTTFSSQMVRAMRERRPFLGQPTSWTRVTWLTEERPVTFKKALRRAHLDACDVGEVCCIFRLDVAKLPWPALIASCLSADQQMGGGGILIVDTLSRFVGLGPDQEKDPAIAARAMEPLLECARAGMAVVVHRHARKAGGDPSAAGRGSPAWSADCDIILLLRRPPKEAGSDSEITTPSRTRLLEAASRFDETPGQDEPQTILLTPDGYGLTGGDTARQQRNDLIDEQIVVFIAGHQGYTRNDTRSAQSIRAKASVIDQRIQHLLDTGRLAERLAPRTDSRNRVRQVMALYLGPNA